MAPSNAVILTRQSKAWAHKKRAKQGRVKEITFDEAARRDYLTGFQKRNVEKKKVAKAKAAQREKAEHLEERRQARKELRERAKTNFEAVEKAYGGEALDLLDNTTSTQINEHEDEYSDDEHLVTVAIVEDFDPTADMHGAPIAQNDQSESEPVPAKGKSKTGENVPKPTSSSKPKLPVRKIRYETKAAVRATHAKALAQRRNKKAERIATKRGPKSRAR